MVSVHRATPTVVKAVHTVQSLDLVVMTSLAVEN